MNLDLSFSGYDIIIIINQCNSTNTADVNNTIDSDIWQLKYNNRAIIPLQEGLDANRKQAINDIGLSFAKEYKEDGKVKPGRKILLINCEVNNLISRYGSKSRKIGKKSSDTNVFSLCAARVNSGLNLASRNGAISKVIAILWNQGENDSKYIKSSPTKYKRIIRDMLISLRKYIGASDKIPILLGKLIPSEITTIIREIPNTFPNDTIVYVNSEGLMNNQIEFGKRYYNQYKELALSSGGFMIGGLPPAPINVNADIVIYGATSGGVLAAVRAAKMGKSVHVR